MPGSSHDGDVQPDQRRSAPAAAVATCRLGGTGVAITPAGDRTWLSAAELEEIRRDRSTLDGGLPLICARLALGIAAF